MAWSEQTGPHSWRVRYLKPDGSLGSISGFATKTAADNRANDLEADQRAGAFRDPNAGQIPFADWARNWIASIDVEPRTLDGYRSKLRCHLLPRWGQATLASITPTAIGVWSKQLHAGGLGPVTVSDILKLLSLMLADAVDEGLLTLNPARTRRATRSRRRGHRQHPQRRERIWATPAQVLAICDQAAYCYGPGGAILILTGAYTGARWGELTGLQRPNLHLDNDHHASMTIDPEIGCLHEYDDGTLRLGPPKTPESARTVSLPPFLIPLLREWLTTHTHPHVFVTPNHTLHRRSNFNRRAIQPAAAGRPNARLATQSVCPGLTFHGLRHSHKTWMIADGIPEVGQARRLGHKLSDRIQDIYSHVADEVERRLLTGLQHRWETALAHANPCPTAWRASTSSTLTDRPTTDSRQ